ncbi:MAG: MBOAT family O-acyltransferase, partial [Oscillospiraceae bacterium]
MFGSISFIFLFLPILVMIYYLASDKYKNFVLSLASIAFYFMLSPKYLAVMLVSIFFDFAMSFAMKSANQNMKKRAIPLLGSIVKNVVLIAGVVYVCKQAETALPVGIFIYTFTAMGYIIDVYEGEVPYENNIIDFTLFCCFFGKLVFGPIITYKEFLASSTAKKHDIKTISKGGVLFIQGVAKLEIISQSMFGIYIDFKEICLENRTIFASWGLIFCLSMAVYYMLSGYCDIARGTAKLFGFELQENMVYPYTSPSVKEFFATFNKSVAAFFGKYVFLPLGGAKRGVVYSTFNILLMCMLWGVWFGFDINFALWGIYIGIFICFEQFYFGDVLKKLPEFVGKFYSRIVILL